VGVHTVDGHLSDGDVFEFSFIQDVRDFGPHTSSIGDFWLSRNLLDQTLDFLAVLEGVVRLVEVGHIADEVVARDDEHALFKVCVFAFWLIAKWLLNDLDWKEVMRESMDNQTVFENLRDLFHDFCGTALEYYFEHVYAGHIENDVALISEGGMGNCFLNFFFSGHFGKVDRKKEADLEARFLCNEDGN